MPYIPQDPSRRESAGNMCQVCPITSSSSIKAGRSSKVWLFFCHIGVLSVRFDCGSLPGGMLVGLGFTVWVAAVLHPAKGDLFRTRAANSGDGIAVEVLLAVTCTVVVGGGGRG